MIKPKIPANEKERLNALKKYEILDTESEVIFDSLTKLAALICDVPICLISLIDDNRQWFKSRNGLSAIETPREISFCGHAINEKKLFYVEDATKDERFFDNPLVTGAPNVIFYAGEPLIDEEGFALGTLCVIDNKAKQLTEHQKEQLEIIGKQVAFLIKSRIEIKKKDQAHSLLKKLSENLPGFIYTFQLFPDGRSCFPYSSRLIEEMYEVSSEEVEQCSKKVFSTYHPDDEQMILDSIEESGKKMTKWTLDYRVNLPKAGPKWHRVSANPEKAADGSIVWHGYIYDITEKKRQEEIFNNSAKMATLGEIAAGIAHEINNPLAIIKSVSLHISNAVKRNDIDEEKLTKSLDKINNTTDRIAKIVKGLRFFAGKSEDCFLKNESIYNIVEDTVSLCSEKFKVNNVELRLIYPENREDLFVQCRAVEVSQVLLNLLNNSFDAIELLEKRWIEIKLENKLNTITISVSDCGNGIPLELQEKMFTPFFTTKACGKGTGLGLSIVQRIVSAHKAKIWIENECENTKFVIEFLKTHDALKVPA